MSLLIGITACCDTCGVEFEGEPAQTKQALNVRIERAGWARKNGELFCPKHAKECKPDRAIQRSILERYGATVVKALNPGLSFGARLSRHFGNRMKPGNQQGPS